MKFTLKNAINNLIKAFNSIKTDHDDDIDKKYQRLNEMLLDYLHRDIVNSKKYFSLLEIEYFLLTDFIDIKEEEFDIGALRAVFDNFCDDIDSVEWYFFDNKHMLMIIEEILKNHLDFPYYDYTKLAKALRESKTRELIEKLHPSIYSDIEEIKKQQELEREGVKFLDKSISSPLEFFLEVKFLIASGKNIALIKQYVNEKLQQIKENDAELFKKLIAIILKFFYLYYVTNQFSFQKDKAGIANSFAEMLSNMLEETESNEVLLSSVDDIDIYIDILSEVPILYNMPYNKTLEKTLTKKQAHVYEQLNG